MESDLEKIEIKTILETLDFENQIVLEIGCGDGRITKQIAPHAKKIYAIDNDEKEIEKAKNLNIKNVRFKVDNGENPDFPKNFFDIVIYSLSLHHLNAKESLNNILPLLRSNSMILVIEPYYHSKLGEVYYQVAKDEEELIERTYYYLTATKNIILNDIIPYEIFHKYENFNEVIENIEKDLEQKINNEQKEKIKIILDINDENQKLKISDKMNLFLINYKRSGSS
ncbi:MAG: class I SAM-dependent methyltransferase [Candidatus Woesearchaeota archaeon]|jgi:ubiquinone/menaquinone biosynthesis C-methylase UbiE|nr:class I SAM-dependent methyltransferase [Candidatus Woesearchaeota archaeon]